jgi:hypothetical protein
VRPWEEWKHVKLGLFHVPLPGEDELIITTKEQLPCSIKSNFGIVIGGPEKGREDRLAKATISCPAKRSMRQADRIELAFFRDWARNYCRTAVVNSIKELEYVPLIENPDYRQRAEKQIENTARELLANIGMLLVECTVVVEPNEPAGVFAIKEILDKWQQYKGMVNAAAVATLRLQAAHNLSIKTLEEEKKRSEAKLVQETTIKLRELEQQRKQRENEIDVIEQHELGEKDKKIKEIQKEIEQRAQEAQSRYIQYEEQLVQERALLKRLEEDRNLQYQQEQLTKKKSIAENELEIKSVEQKLNAIQVELERSRGDVKAANIEKEALATKAHETKMRQLLIEVLPKIAEQVVRPVEKIGEIRAINVGTTNGGELTQPNIGTILASASTLQVIREIFRFVNDLEETKAQNGDTAHGIVRTQGHRDDR